LEKAEVKFSSIDKDPQAPWGRGNSNVTILNLLWFPSEWVPFFLKKAVFRIPFKRSWSKFVHNYKAGPRSSSREFFPTCNLIHRKSKCRINPTHSIETYEVAMKIALYSFLISVLEEVSGQLHVPAYSPLILIE